MYSLALALATLNPCEQRQQVYKPLELRAPVQDKNFFFLSLLARGQQTLALLTIDPKLSQIAKEKKRALEEAAKLSTIGRVEGLVALKFNPGEVAQVSLSLQNLLTADSSRMKLTVKRLRESGCYLRYQKLDDDQFLMKSWQECAAGINNVIDIYGTQVAEGPSSGINGPIYKLANPLFGGLVKTMLLASEEDLGESPAFFESTLAVAVGLLYAQNRDEAGREEPLDSRQNAAAYRRAKHMDWRRYPYSVIVVPGYGPEESQIHLSPVGRLACERAAKRYKAGKAPFILTSGGYVHPNLTPYCEAIEMKRCLVQDFGVPEQAILIDPHARHTTTNMRNAARMLFRYGFPADRPGLVVTNPFQASDICSPSFQKRCRASLGYEPCTGYTQISPFEVTFVPQDISLSIDPADPLDP